MDALERAKNVKPTERYVDPASKHIQDWQWRPLEEVQNELNLHEIPSHVHEFGKFMDRTAERAGREGLTPRDLLKAYTITRASIQRRATPAENLHKSGLVLPPDVTGMVRPEGAFGHWLHTPAGQAYLDAAQRGRVHEPAVQDAMERMKPFGKHNDLADALRWGAQNLPDKASAVSHLVAAGREHASSPQEWRNFVGDIRGIGPSKAGFVASLMGRGDQPTLDARQIIMHTGRPSKEASAHIARKGGKGGEEAVDRLAARQTAMNLTTPKGMEPYYQHLAHHAVWDKAGNEMTTHQDVMDAMQHAATGGAIHSHPVARVIRAMHPEGFGKGGTAKKSSKGPTLEDIKAQLNQPWNPPSTEEVKRALDAELVARNVLKGDPTRGLLSKTVYSTPADQMSVTKAGHIPMIGHKDALPSDLQGSILMAAPGDRTDAGHYVTHLNGKKLAWPVYMEGGRNFGLAKAGQGKDPAGWASKDGVVSGFQNRAQMYQQLYPNMPVNMMYSAMNTHSGDSSHMMTELALAQMPHSKITDKAAGEFDKYVRGWVPDSGRDMSDFPGIGHPDVREYLHKHTGAARSAFIKEMAKPRHHKNGFPDIASTRNATLDSRVENVPGNPTGSYVFQMDPSRSGVTDPEHPHRTYNSQVPSLGYRGDIGNLFRYTAFPSQKANYEARGIRPESHDFTFEKEKVGQIADQKWVDNAMREHTLRKSMGLLARGGRTAYKKGGKVEGSIWHARDAFEDGGPTEHESLNAMAGRTGENTEADATPPSYSDMPDNVQQAQLDLNNKGREANEATNARRAGEAAAADAAFNAKNPDFNTPPSAETKAEEVQNPQPAPSAALSAEAMMSKAFGPTTSFGQQPPQAGAFKPEHFESTLEQNLVEPAFSQPVVQPAFPHTPTPKNDLTGISAPAGTIDSSPLGATTSNATTRGLRDAITQDLGPTTVSTPEPAPAPFQPNANAASRQARDAIQQSMGPTNAAQRQARDAIAQNMGPAPTEPEPTPVAPAPIAAAAPAKVPMPSARPAELGPSATSNNIFNQINSANLKRISELEAQPNVNNPGYFNSTSGLSKEQWAKQMNADPNMVQTRLVDQGNGMQPDYYTKGLDQAFGEMAGGIMAAPGAIMSGIGNAFSPQHYDPITGQSRSGISPFVGSGSANAPEFGNHGGGQDQTTPAKSKTHMVQKQMPDGTFQWVEEPFKKGGKVYRRTVGSQMTDHVISKFGAKLPASNYQPTGSKAGRR
jgi:hypothetical protein